jgi:predicted restriction endonuclease
MNLVLGQIYRRSELHDFFGGSRQSGISPTSKGNQVLIFSNKKGGDHGYEDGWDEDEKYYRYTGAGQSGDQDIESSRHNGRLRHHIENGDSVRLFSGTERPGYYLYEAELQYVDHEFFQTPDTEGNNRRAVMFIFEELASTGINIATENSGFAGTKRGSGVSYRKPDTTSRKGLVTSRVGQGYYRHEVLKRFGSACAVTGANREELLIASHIVPWRTASEEERLDVDNGILLSPTYDALFDRNLISFEEDGQILVSSKLSPELLVQLGVTGSEKIEIFEGMKPYLKRHRNNLQ